MKVLLQTLSTIQNKIYEPLGTNNQTIIDDLKTLNGILKRINKYNLNHSKPFRLYQYNDLIKDFHNNKQVLIYEELRNLKGLENY